MLHPIPERWSKARRRRIILRLNCLAVLAVTGEDAQSFLQGQLSNDVTALAQGRAQSQLTAYCNPKGRGLAVIRLLPRADGFCMLVPAELAEQLVKRLQMFVLRAQVQIARQPQTALLGIVDWPAPAHENENEHEESGEDGEAETDTEILRIPIDGILPRQLLLGEKSAIQTWLTQHAPACQPNDDCWRFVDIRSGIPQIYRPTTEQFIPQMLNLDLVGGLSFTKGCYPGQEIVARLRYLGKLKQRMIIGQVKGQAQRLARITPGEAIYVTDDSASATDGKPAAPQKVGQVVDAVKTADNEYTLSATAPTNLQANAELRLGSATGAIVTRVPLPYAIPSPAAASK